MGAFLDLREEHAGKRHVAYKHRFAGEFGNCINSWSFFSYGHGFTRLFVIGHR